MRRSPPFIVLEGLDGAGTTTQCGAIALALRAEGQSVFVTAEPSTGPIGVMVRQALARRLVLPESQGPMTSQTLALLFAADRLDHLAAQIEPAIDRGETVICDRYVLSSLAYQGPGVGLDWVTQLNRQARAPDLTLFLSVDVGTARVRRDARGGAEELFESDEIQRRTARWYAKAIEARRSVGDVIELIDGRQAREQVSEECLEMIRGLRTRRRKPSA
jgi:dTMP kinase